MPKLEWTRMFGILGDTVVEVEAYPVEEGYIVKLGCRREFVETARLSKTRSEAQGRLGALGQTEKEKP